MVAPHPEWSAFRESSFGVGRSGHCERDARVLRVAPRRVRRGDGAALRPRCKRLRHTPRRRRRAARRYRRDRIAPRRACVGFLRRPQTDPPPVAPFPDDWGTSDAANDDDAPPP